MSTTTDQPRILDRAELEMLAEALYMRAQMTLDCRADQWDRSVTVSTCIRIAENHGIGIEPDAERFLGWRFVLPAAASSMMTHPTDCERCADALRNAESHARVMGSLGATYVYDDTACGGEVHEARWSRLP